MASAEFFPTITQIVLKFQMTGFFVTAQETIPMPEKSHYQHYLPFSLHSASFPLFILSAFYFVSLDRRMAYLDRQKKKKQQTGIRKPEFSFADQLSNPRQITSLHTSVSPSVKWSWLC